MTSASRPAVLRQWVSKGITGSRTREGGQIPQSWKTYYQYQRRGHDIGRVALSNTWRSSLFLAAAGVAKRQGQQRHRPRKLRISGSALGRQTISHCFPSMLVRQTVPPIEVTAPISVTWRYCTTHRSNISNTLHLISFRLHACASARAAQCHKNAAGAGWQAPGQERYISRPIRRRVISSSKLRTSRPRSQDARRAQASSSVLITALSAFSRTTVSGSRPVRPELQRRLAAAPGTWLCAFDVPDHQRGSRRRPDIVVSEIPSSYTVLTAPA